MKPEVSSAHMQVCVCVYVVCVSIFKRLVRETTFSINIMSSPHTPLHPFLMFINLKKENSRVDSIL